MTPRTSKLGSYARKLSEGTMVIFLAAANVCDNGGNFVTFLQPFSMGSCNAATKCRIFRQSPTIRCRLDQSLSSDAKSRCVPESTQEERNRRSIPVDGACLPLRSNPCRPPRLPPHPLPHNDERKPDCTANIVRTQYSWFVKASGEFENSSCGRLTS